MDVTELEQLPTFPDRGPAPGWESLRVDGRVAHPLALTADDLARLPQSKITEDFLCKEGWVVPAQVWEGVPVGELLAAAGPLAEAKYVAFSAGEFSVALDLKEAKAGSALLALRLNGQPLPPDHGGPCRLVVPGADCYTSIKWLDHVEVTEVQPVETAREIALGRIGQLDTSDNS